MTSWMSHLSTTSSFFFFTFSWWNWSTAPPPRICSHSQNICLGCSSGQGGGQTSPPCFFWPKTPPFILPLFLLLFLLLTCFHTAGWSWMTIHARCCWIWMFVFVCVWESLKAMTSPSSDVCQAIQTHTHTLTMPRSSLDSVPYLPHRGLQSCHFSSHQHHSSKNDKSTQTPPPLALSRRYPVVSCIRVASSCGSASCQWKRNVCWSQRRSLCTTNLWLQIAAICQNLWWKNNSWHTKRIKPPFIHSYSTWAACRPESCRCTVCHSQTVSVYVCGDDWVPVK